MTDTADLAPPLAEASPLPPRAEAAPPADTASPYLGLRSFSESDRELFHGREAETDELFHLVQRETLSVVFGISGLGKSSLLRAGLFPRLRAAGLFPVAVRLTYGARDLVAQLRTAIAREIAERDVDAIPPPDDQTLWEYFHRTPFWSARNRPLVPVIVLDQFEELFTLGHAATGSRALLTELGDVIENRIPDAVRRAGDADKLPPTFEVPKAKVILSLREDYLARLEDLRAAIPALARGRFRLRPMDGAQAVRAVRHARTAHLIDAAVAEHIVRFVAGARGDAAALDTLTVEPALLSLVCRQLDEIRAARREPTISADLLTGQSARILDDFYERSIADLDPKIVDHIEGELLTPDGHRTTVAMSSLEPIAGVAPAVTTLIERRILRIEERLGHPHVEVIHDVLTRVMVARRDRRRTEHERRRRSRRRIATLATAALALVLVAGTALYLAARRRLAAATEHQRFLVERERKADALRSGRTLAAEASAMLERDDVWAAARVLKVAYGIAGEDHAPDLGMMVGRLTGLDRMLAAVLPASSGVTALAFSGDGTKLFAGHRDGSVSIWSTTSWQLTRLVAGAESSPTPPKTDGTSGGESAIAPPLLSTGPPVVALAVSEDGGYALAASSGKATIWSTTKRRVRGSFRVLKPALVRVTDDGNWATSSDNVNDRVYRFRDGRYTEWQPPALSPACRASPAGDGAALVTGRDTHLRISGDGSNLAVWQYEAGDRRAASELSVFSLRTPEPVQLAATCIQARAGVALLAVNFDGTAIALQEPCVDGPEDCTKTWTMYRRSTSTEKLKLAPAMDLLGFDAHRPDLAISMTRDTVSMTSLDGRAQRTTHSPCGSRPRVDLTEDRLAMIGACGRFLLVDGNRPPVSGEVPFASYSALRISAAARLAATLSPDGVIRVWKLDRSLDRVIRTPPDGGAGDRDQQADVAGIAYNGNEHLTAYDGDQVRMLSVESGDLIATAHSGTMPAVLDDGSVALAEATRLRVMTSTGAIHEEDRAAAGSLAAMLVAGRDPAQVLWIGPERRYRWIDSTLQSRDEQALDSELLHAAVRRIAYAPSGRWMLGAGTDGTVTRFDADGHRVTSAALPGGVHDIVPAIHGDGLLAVGRQAIVAWPDSGPPRIIETTSSVNGRAAAWDLAAGAIFLGTNDGLVRLDAASGAPAWRDGAPFTHRHDATARDVVWIDLDGSSARPAVLAASRDAMGLFDGEDGHLLRDFPASASVSLDRLTGSWFVVPDLLLTLADELALWNVRTGARVSSIREISGVARGPADRFAITLPQGVTVAHVQDQTLTRPEPLLPCSRSVDDSRVVAWSPDGQWIATACGRKDDHDDGGAKKHDSISVWNAATKQVLGIIWDSSHPRITEMSFSPGHRLLTNGSDGTPRLWDVLAGTKVAEIAHERVLAAAFVQAKPYIMTHVGGRSIRVYDAHSARQTAELPWTDASGAIAVHAIDETTGLFAVAGDRGNVIVIDIRAGKVVRALPPSHEPPVAIAIARGGGSIALASADGMLLWRSGPGAAFDTKLAASHVAATTFSPDGNWLATVEDLSSGARSTGSRGLLRIWRDDGKELLSFVVDAVPTAVSWSPDSRRVAVGGRGGFLKMFDLTPETRSPGSVIEILDRIAPRAGREATSPFIMDRLPPRSPRSDLIDI
jgi:WD40 repeat protein